ncbi:DUF2612 domain-containing structural protein [Rhizobium phage RHph_I72]|nr:DUF2612 domain-containing structural protein [Rhizobium phage RHph_I65]QIG76502.1 DUF2612 domain-containing structural protein [Rhizobium phage RHph_I72]
MTCVDESVLVESEVDRVLTQYRESPKLLHMIRTYLRQIASIHTAICDMPSFFDLYQAVGDQLTLIGRRMGFPRCHCICDVQPVFGFPCDNGQTFGRTIVGFCQDGSWSDCDTAGISEICINDDEMYRKFLISRSYQMQQLYSLEDLTSALQALYGEQAMVLDSGHGRVVLAPYRELTDDETALLQVVPRVLPIAPGITTRWHFGTFKVFGFGTGWGSFCEDWAVDGALIDLNNGFVLGDEDDDYIVTGPLTRGADWMCEIDLKPYSC